MANTYGGSGDGSNTGEANVVVTMSATPTAGALVVLALYVNSEVTISGVGGTSTWVTNITGVSNDGWTLLIAYTLSAAGSETQYTVTFSGVCNTFAAAAWYSGETYAFDGTAGASGTSATADSGPYTTTNANDILIGAGGNSNAETMSASDDGQSGSYSNMNWSAAVGIMGEVVAATAAYRARMTLTSAAWVERIVAFKAPAGGASSTPSSLQRGMYLGMGRGIGGVA